MLNTDTSRQDFWITFLGYTIGNNQKRKTQLHSAFAAVLFFYDYFKLRPRKVVKTIWGLSLSHGSAPSIIILPLKIPLEMLTQ